MRFWRFRPSWGKQTLIYSPLKIHRIFDLMFPVALCAQILFWTPAIQLTAMVICRLLILTSGMIEFNFCPLICACSQIWAGGDGGSEDGHWLTLISGLLWFTWGYFPLLCSQRLTGESSRFGILDCSRISIFQFLMKCHSCEVKLAIGILWCMKFKKLRDWNRKHKIISYTFIL